MRVAGATRPASACDLRHIGGCESGTLAGEFKSVVILHLEVDTVLESQPLLLHYITVGSGRSAVNAETADTPVFAILDTQSMHMYFLVCASSAA